MICSRVYLITLMSASNIALAVQAADLPAVPVNQSAVSEDGIWTTVLDIDSKFSSWRGTRGFPTSIDGKGKGYQFYMPFGISLSGTPGTDWKYEFQARSGYAFSKQSTIGAAGSVNTLTDTTLQATVTYLGIDGVVPFAAMNINAPTGTAALYRSARFARMDADLVDLSNFGEGWNFGPSLGANIPITDDLLVTLGAGYTHRGGFRRETDDGTGEFITRQKMKAGNTISFNASATYQLDSWSFMLGASYATESKTYVDGIENFRAGDRMTFLGSITQNWNNTWSTVLSGNLVLSDKNENLPLGGVSIIPETYNSNNRVFRIGLDHYWTEGNWTLGPSVSYLDREKNAYDSLNYSFIPAKTRYAGGGVAKYKLNDTILMSARVDRIWTHEKDYPITNVPAVKSNAWFLSLGAALTY